MAIRRISSGGPYEAKAAYCRAVVAGGWVHVAGTVAGLDPVTGEPPQGSAAQCVSALAIIENALREAGSSFADVVRVTYMLPAISEFEVCWPALRDAFGQNPPVSTAFECALIDPKFRIEIEVTAYMGDGQRS